MDSGATAFRQRIFGFFAAALADKAAKFISRRKVENGVIMRLGTKHIGLYDFSAK